MTTDNLTNSSAGTSTRIDRDKLKIASFRTKEGMWADFTAAANKIGLTATDVIKAAMEQFIAGEYIPSINTGTHTAVNTQSGITRDEIQELIDTAVGTLINTDTLDASIMTIVSTLSLPTEESVKSIVDTAVSMALVPIRDEVRAEIEAIKNSLSIPEKSKTTASTPVRKPSESLDLKTATDASWGAFHQVLGLDCPPSSKKSADLGAIASDRATEMGFVGWTFNSKKQRFYRS